jgi:hypothetical protein
MAPNHPDHGIVKNKAVMTPGSVDFTCSQTDAAENTGDILRWKFWRPGQAGAGIIIQETEIYAILIETVSFGLNLKEFPAGTMS